MTLLKKYYQMALLKKYYQIALLEKYLGWMEGRKDRQTEVKQYTPLPLRGVGV
jgi:hypothetical protein